MFRRNGDILARNDLAFAAEIEPLPDWAINSAEDGKLVVLPGAGDRMRALIKLIGFVDVYLYVARSLQPEVVDHTRQIQAVVRDYQRLEDERYGIQITFVIIFILIALLVLLSAVWLGLQFATVSPIRSGVSSPLPTAFARASSRHASRSPRRMTRSVRSAGPSTA